jgi:hypothetical protein
MAKTERRRNLYQLINGENRNLGSAEENNLAIENQSRRQ